jgi:hypothetical protein
MSKLRTLLPALIFALVAVACDGGYEPDEAKQQCDDYRARIGACVDDAAYDQCILCFEDCGSECTLSDSNCPHSFACED